MSEYSLAERLRVARAYTGWSQTELAKRAHLHSVQISKLERGVTKEITGSTLKALCQAMGVSPAYLLGMQETMDASPVVPLGKPTLKRHRPPHEQQRGAQPTPVRRPVWERIQDAFSHVPEAELAAWPVDGAAQVDHYLYETPKR